MRSRIFALAVLVALLSGGCYRHTYYVAGTTPEASAREWRWNHHFLWGLLNVSPPIPVNAVCPSGVARVENWIGPGQAILSWITVGIYTPTTDRVFCRIPPGRATAGGDSSEALSPRAE